MMRKSLRRREAGFSLIEVLVVVIIVVGLAAVSIPVLLNQKERAANTAVQQTVGDIARVVATGVAKGSLSGADGSTSGLVTSETGSIAKNGAVAYANLTTGKYCVSMQAPSGQFYSATSSSQGAYMATKKCTSATSTPLAGVSGVLIVPTGTIDPEFTNPTVVVSGAADKVRTVDFLSDGRMVIGGIFTSVGGVARGKIALLSEAGTLDTSFTASFSEVNRIAVASGMIYVGTRAGVSCVIVCRLFSNGNRDSSFNTQHLVLGASYESGTDGRIVLPQANGQIYAGGYLAGAGSGVVAYPTDYAGIVRLNANGSLDTSFNPPTFGGGGTTIGAAAVQEDGKVIVGGSFSSVNGDTNYKYLVRLNTNGTLDTGFNVPSGLFSGILVPSAIAVDDSGRVLVSGYNITTIYRFSSNGTRDTSFNSCSARSYRILVLPDGKYLAAGGTSTSGAAARLNANGGCDSTFTRPSFNATVLDAVQAPDGKYVFVGNFTNTGYPYILRVT